jgi:hypothetical protein
MLVPSTLTGWTTNTTIRMAVRAAKKISRVQLFSSAREEPMLRWLEILSESSVSFWERYSGSAIATREKCPPLGDAREKPKFQPCLRSPTLPAP